MFRLLNPFRWFEQDISLRGKIIVAVFFLSFMAGGGIVSYKFYDYTQNNPNFCVSCHLMQEAFQTWEESEHAGINCHDCHHLSVEEMNQLLVSFIFHRPTEVPDRHGKITHSQIHAKHVFMEKLECTKCHGYLVHEFTPEERFCIKCHQGKTVHGTGMDQLACLNCHTDRTTDLRPGPKKCLFCHGEERIRQELIADGTLDVTHYMPDKTLIEKATKIDKTDTTPMQFYCYTCHKPHKAARPDWSNCTDCHKNIKNVGKHKLHIEMMGMQCKRCHKPHGWTVTPEQVKKECIGCHGYKDPKDFLKA
jgi:nitrate reductase cytochrome c-type subunit